MTQTGRRRPGTPPAVGTAAAAAMSERELASAVATMCKQLGLLRYHTHRSDRSEPGWCDEVLLGPRGVLFRELKRQNGRLTGPQQVWLDGLRAVGLDADVWRPDDLHSGRVATELAAISRLRVAAGPRH